MHCKSALLATLAAIVLIFPTAIYATSPITGTFIAPDISYQSVAEYRQFFQELKDSGIDTVIFNLTGNLDKNCTTKQYVESNYLHTTFAGSGVAWFPTAIPLAKEMGMRMFFGVGDYNAPYDCFTYHSGRIEDESTDKGRLIAFSLRTMDSVKNLVTSELHIDWNDPNIGGWYLVPEESTQLLSIADQAYGVTYPQFAFYRDFASAVKRKDPSKKILISPFQFESTDYDTSKQAFLNLFSSDIDIVSPQDSLGTGVTTSFGRSADHFRALKDAKSRYPSKEAWANIETFSMHGTGTDYIPSALSKIDQQISAVQPNVSKMIMWIYQYTMLSNPLSDNVAARNQYAPEYTPEKAALRKTLRRTYLEKYSAGSSLSCSPLYVYSIAEKKCQPTNSVYTTDQYQCLNNAKSNLTCAQNLAAYPGKSTGTCYSSLDLCDRATDLTGDGQTTSSDYQRFLSYYQAKNTAGDFDKDGDIDIYDYNMLTAYYR